MAIRGCTCGHPGAGCYCPPSNWIDDENLNHTRAMAKVMDEKMGDLVKAEAKKKPQMDAVVQKRKEKATYPDDFFHPKGTDEGDNNGHYVIDRLGTVWMVVRDGGMVQTCDYGGRVFSAGIVWLEKNHGPLVPVNERVLRYAHERNNRGTKKAHPRCMIDNREE